MQRGYRPLPVIYSPSKSHTRSMSYHPLQNTSLLQLQPWGLYTVMQRSTLSSFNHYRPLVLKFPEFASDRRFYAPRYHVDRWKSIRVLESFLSKKEQKVREEAQWLREIKADCVLSDAAFLALCAACFFLIALGPG
jgi:hypothetical protein